MSIDIEDLRIDIRDILKRIEQLEERVRRLESDILPIRRIGPVLNQPIYKPFEIQEEKE